MNYPALHSFSTYDVRGDIEMDIDGDRDAGCGEVHHLAGQSDEGGYCARDFILNYTAEVPRARTRPVCAWSALRKCTASAGSQAILSLAEEMLAVITEATA